MIEFVDIDHAQELDAFVTAHEWSHFMQTSLWGRVKSDWGWLLIPQIAEYWSNILILSRLLSSLKMLS